MATRGQIVETLARRRFNKHYWPNRSRQQLRQSAQSLSNVQWDHILSSMGANDSIAGMIIRERLQEHLMGLAVQDIEARLGANDTLTISELEDLF